MIESVPVLSPLVFAVRALRPRQWWHFAPLPLAGLDFTVPLPELIRQSALGIAAASALLGAAYGANAIGDRRSDRDPIKNPLIGVVEASGAAVAVAAAALTALAAAWSAGPLALAAAAVSLAAGLGYSLGPRWKARPVVGLIADALIFLPLPLLCSWPGGLRAAWLGPALAVLLVQSQLLHEGADAAEDAAASDRTTAAWLGADGTRRVLLAAGIAGGASALALGVGGPHAWLAVPAVALHVLATVAALRAGDAAAVRGVHRRVGVAGGAVLFAAVAVGSA